MMERDPEPYTPDLEPSGDALPLAAGYQRLEDALLDESFPEVDMALRRGRHIHKGDERWFRFLSEAQGLLEPFYRRYGCELEQRGDGYFFLLPVSDGLGKRHLGVPEMIVGQGLALCYLDPQSVQSGGMVTREELLNQLAAVMGTDALMRTLNPKRKRVDERVMQRTVRQKVNEALRRLSLLGFVELLGDDQLRLAASLMRFAEPVRGLDAPSEALKRLIERGEVSLGPGDAEPRDADDDEAEEIEEELDAPPPESARMAAAEPGSERTDEPDPSEMRGGLACDEVAPSDTLDPEPRPAPEPLGAGAAAVGERLDAPSVEAAPAPPDLAPEHVEIDFDWDTLPDEEA
ncbi:MAG TPA: chromosome partition protein MukE [Polyangiaceae bacterium]|nr:chromosome partition protein MukE [Polyangiaceae bacterium]